MAFSKRTITREIFIRQDESGNITAFRIPLVQVLEDGVVIAEREGEQINMTLTQVKAIVAAL